MGGWLEKNCFSIGLWKTHLKKGFCFPSDQQHTSELENLAGFFLEKWWWYYWKSVMYIYRVLASTGEVACCVLLHFLSSCGKPSGVQFPSTKQWGSICTWGWAALISPTGPCSGLDQEPKNWDLFSAACPSNIKLYTYLRAIYVISDINELTTAT